MIRNKQLVCDSEKGDCFRACVTSILGIPNDPALPNVDDPDWFIKWHKFLHPFGIDLKWDNEAVWRQGYWIATVKSKNFKGVTHAIVMKGHKVAHDPNLKNRYRVGTDLLGTKEVVGGWWFEIMDFEKLRRWFLIET